MEDIFYEIKKAHGVDDPRAMRAFIHDLSFIDQLSKKLSKDLILPSDTEEFLYVALDALGYAIFKVDVNSAMGREIGRLALTYAVLSRSGMFRPERSRMTSAALRSRAVNPKVFQEKPAWRFPGI